MRADRIQVLSPRTWGKFGNYLAATRLAGAVQDQVGGEVRVLEAESLAPWLGEIGERIRRITVDSPDTGTRSCRYLALMDELAGRFPPGFEVEPIERTAIAGDVAGLAAHLRATQPDLVIGTKGLVSRLCLAASRSAGTGTPVANFVTNPGLLDLAIHRTNHVDLTMVPYPWAKARLLTDEGGDPDRVRVVGPLIARHDLRDFLTLGGDDSTAAHQPWGGPDGPARPKLIVFCNRGGEDYLAIVAHLARHHPHVDLVFVGYDDPALAAHAAARAGSADVSHWRFHTRLTQSQYFDYIEQASAAEHALLISKVGPNTTLEAAHFGIPVLLLDSGLPMEGWVPGLIREHSLGSSCRTVEELLGVLDRWLGDPALIAAHRRAAVAYARSALDQTAVERRIGDAVRALLGRSAAGGNVDGEDGPAAAAERAVEHLLAARDAEGWWHDFSAQGASTMWVTAYVGTALADDPRPGARTAARHAWALLAGTDAFSDGWGYRAGIPADADSTAWALRLAEASGAPPSDRLRRACAFLEHHVGPDGGVATYSQELAGWAFELAGTYERWDAWCATHLCVTAAAAGVQALPARPRLLDLLRRSQSADGSWPAYWWEDPLYSTALACEALPVADRDALDRAAAWATARVDQDGAVRTPSDPSGSSFATAWAVRVLAVVGGGDSALRARERAVGWLTRQQRADGGWPPSARLRLPPPDTMDPGQVRHWRRDGKGLAAIGTIVVDTSGLFTTATVLRALRRTRPDSYSTSVK